MSASAQRRTAAAAAIMMLFAVLQYVLYTVNPTPARAATEMAVLDFESGLASGDIVSLLDVGTGISGADAGSVPIDGTRTTLPGVNQAMIFDATCGGSALTCTGQDPDLYQPTLGNVLIISEDGDSSDPDDADVGEEFTFDFSGWGPGVVTVVSIDVLDVEAVEVTGANIDVDGSSVDIPEIGDGNFQTVAVGFTGSTLKVILNGSGAIDNVRIEWESEDEPVDVSVSGECVYNGVASFLYTVSADAGVTVDFDGGDQNLTDGETYVSSSGSASWVATAPSGSVFVGASSGTVNVEDCTPPPPGEVTVSVSGECVYNGVASFVYTVSADAGVTVDFDGGDQNLTDGETYVSSSGSASWVATAPSGSVFSGASSGTVNVEDCTPPSSTTSTTTPPRSTTTTTTPTVLSALGDLVWFDENQNGQQDDPEIEFPINGATVTLLAPDGTVLEQQVTGLDGLYLFDELEAGTYRVEVCVEGAEYTITDAVGVADAADSDVFPLADKAGCALTALIDLPAGVTDLTWDAGLVIDIRGIQVEPTTTTTAPTTTTIEPVTVETLPFTGFETDDMALLGIGVLAAGSVLLVAMRRRDEDAREDVVSGWSND